MMVKLEASREMAKDDGKAGGVKGDGET